MAALRSLTGLLGAAVLCGCAVASARPPTDASYGKPSAAPARSAPLIGRARMRDRVIDLTRESVAEGGAAHELVRGYAEIMADIDVDISKAQRP